MTRTDLIRTSLIALTLMTLAVTTNAKAASFGDYLKQMGAFSFEL